MTENKTSRALHNDSSTSKATVAALGGHFPDRRAAPPPTPMARQDCTLHVHIPIITASQQR
jgi:hypothetical protein